MLWELLFFKGPGSTVHLHGIMDSRNYQEIWNENLIASTTDHGWIFQQDNDPKPTSKSSQKVLNEYKYISLYLSQAANQNPSLIKHPREGPVQFFWGKGAVENTKWWCANNGTRFFGLTFLLWSAVGSYEILMFFNFPRKNIICWNIKGNFHSFSLILNKSANNKALYYIN